MRLADARLCASACFVVLACGRSGLWRENYGSDGAGGESTSDPTPVDECAIDTDCAPPDVCMSVSCHAPDDTHAARYCATIPVTCDDANACTLDRCDPNTGRCVHQGPSDADHDGVLGKAADGTPASCGGTDCDDTDANVFPGAPELCDGKDNNCDGRIDEGARYTVTTSAPVPIAPQSFRSTSGALLFDGTRYAITYQETIAGTLKERSLFELRAGDGSLQAGPSPVSSINADTYAGVLATAGQDFLTVWADARQAGEYELYSTRFDAKAEKLQADLRLTNAASFSVNPSLSVTPTGYRLVWEDHRFVDSTGLSAVFGRKLTTAGQPDGDEVRLSGTDENADLPQSDVSDTRLGIAYTVNSAALPDGTQPPTGVRFRSFNLDLSDDSGAVEVGTNGQEPSIVRTGATFVMAWNTGDIAHGWGNAIQAAVVDERGNVLAAGPITSGDAFAKNHALVSLGDRVLLVWSAVPTAATKYALYYETVSARDLSIVTPRQLAVATSNDLNSPKAELGPNGDLGMLFDDADGRQAYFTHLSCSIGFGTR